MEQILPYQRTNPGMGVQPPIGKSGCTLPLSSKRTCHAFRAPAHRTTSMNPSECPTSRSFCNLASVIAGRPEKPGIDTERLREEHTRRLNAHTARSVLGVGKISFRGLIDLGWSRRSTTGTGTSGSGKATLHACSKAYAAKHRPSKSLPAAAFRCGRRTANSASLSPNWFAELWLPSCPSSASRGK